MVGLTEPVAAPAPTPAPHSLMATALDVTEAPTMVTDPVTGRERAIDRWTDGFEFLPESCDQGGVWVPCVTVKDVELNPDGLGPDGETSGSGTQLKSDFDSPGTTTFFPYVIEGSWACSTTGFSVADYEGRARRNLDNVTPKQLEHEMWTGVQMQAHPTGAGNMSLVRSTGVDGILNEWNGSDPDTLVPVSIRDALGLLQQGLANCGHGSRGMIHATAFLAEMWGNGNMLKDDGQRLATRTRGTYVVSGGGYPGTGPTVAGDGEPAVPASNQVWAYATGMVNYRLGRVMLNPPDFVQAFDRSSNRVHFTAERAAAAVWDPCCTVAVLVDLTLGIT